MESAFTGNNYGYKEIGNVTRLAEQFARKNMIPEGVSIGRSQTFHDCRHEAMNMLLVPHDLKSQTNRSSQEKCDTTFYGESILDVIEIVFDHLNIMPTEAERCKNAAQNSPGYKNIFLTVIQGSLGHAEKDVLRPISRIMESYSGKLDDSIVSQFKQLRRANTDLIKEMEAYALNRKNSSIDEETVNYFVAKKDVMFKGLLPESSLISLLTKMAENINRDEPSSQLLKKAISKMNNFQQDNIHFDIRDLFDLKHCDYQMTKDLTDWGSYIALKIYVEQPHLLLDKSGGSLSINQQKLKSIKLTNLDNGELSLDLPGFISFREFCEKKDQDPNFFTTVVKKFLEST